MQLKNLAFFLLSATAIASVEKRQSDQMMEDAMEDAKDSLPSQLQDMPMPDPSIMKVMMTAVPPSLMQSPEKMQDVASSMRNGDEPKWVQDLPEDGKEYFSELSDWAQDKAKSGDVPTSMAGGEDSGSSAAETTGAESGSPGASSTGGAPAPTGAVAASVAGAVGILGLAVAL